MMERGFVVSCKNYVGIVEKFQPSNQPSEEKKYENKLGPGLIF